ncbi:LacI family DNA-binding transcriptional regulator [uncultured Marivita sp.]|uniref:LacI family DNA-binding transcriptional regulator n=1 Tax=uncultured Marivita sp. TaxID=888080 RepID=UPI00261BBCE1|nr:LacI family DNA-binding transcriptional regulator [uncultured Marivita sp.]
MARRPTIQDLARAAGVGTATVDRALNDRGNVSARTAKAIAEAALRIGYPMPGAVASLSDASKPRLDLGFVLHKPSQEFYQRFAQEITRACRAVPDATVTPFINFSPSQSPGDFTEAIEAAAADGQVVAATAINHPSLSRLIETLKARGRPVFSLLNDFAGQAGAGYFGLDNMKAGRIAGWMMATHLQRPCRVAVFVGGARWHGHGLREAGFRTALREYAPQITVTDTAVNLETRQVTYEATLDLLERHADLAGLYVAGGGMEGAIAALREARPPGKVALIVNELTSESRAALADHYAILVSATPLSDLCRALVDRMVRAAVDGPPAQAQPRLFEPLLYTPESV